MTYFTNYRSYTIVTIVVAIRKEKSPTGLFSFQIATTTKNNNTGCENFVRQDGFAGGDGYSAPFVAEKARLVK